MTFLEYLALLQRRWRAWVSMIVVGLLLGAGLSLLAEEAYVAVATSFVTVADEEAAGAGEVFQGSQFVTQRMVSYAALSTSPTVVDGVIDELGLDVTPRELRQMVDVSSPTGTVMLEVAVEHPDPEQAALIADTLSLQLADLIEELETPRGLAASSVEVVLTHPANVPVEPSSPRVRLNLLLGGLVGAADGNRYFVDARATSTGQVVLTAGRRVDDVETALQSRTVTGLTAVAGEFLEVRAQAFGTAPTTVRAKVWASGTPEPAAWTVSTTDATAALQAPGGVALRGYLSGSATNAPVTVSFDDLWVGAPE